LVEDGFRNNPTKPVKKQPNSQVSCTPRKQLAVLDSIDALLVIAAASVALESRSSCTRQGTKPVERLERGAPAVRAR